MSGLDPANLPLINDQLTQLRRRKEHLQAELRAARAASRDSDERALRKWATERITGLADAMAGRRNEHVRRVIASYIDEIVVFPTERRGIMRLDAGLAAYEPVGPERVELRLCARLGCRSADFHVHVVLLAIVAERNGLVGALRTIEDYARHGLAPVVADADMVERLAVAVMDLE
jgi:hypothetical protein